MITLRPYQSRAIAATRASIVSGKKAPLIVAPTGAGKTVMGAAIVRGCVERGKKVVWCAHRRELITQGASTLAKLGLSVGYLGRNPHAPVQVASVQTILARGHAPEAEVFVPDEAHHYAADQWGEVLQTYKRAGALVVGFTATPERGDGVGLHGAFDDMIVAAQIGELVELGYLLPSEIVTPTRKISSGAIAQSPVDAWEQYGDNRSTVVFASNVKAAEQFAVEFRARGIAAHVVHGKLADSVRDERLREFDQGRTRVLVNVGVLTEGWDCPLASCCIFARPVGSTSLYLQMVGRVLRPHPDQTHAKVIDLTGVVRKHGPPEEEREYFLEGQAVRRKGEAIGLRFCRVCKAVLGAEGPCTECGSTLIGTEVPKVVGADLEKYAWAEKVSPNKRVNMLARWYIDAYEKGHKEGRAEYKFKTIFKAWPNKATKDEAKSVAERMRA